MRCCRHARVRLRQRGFRQDDHEVILLCGVQVSNEEIIMPAVTANYEIALLQQQIARLWRQHMSGAACMSSEELAAMKQQIHQLERIKNRKIVVRDGVLVTAYKPTKRSLGSSFRSLRGKARRLQRWGR